MALVSCQNEPDTITVNYYFTPPAAEFSHYQLVKATRMVPGEDEKPQQEDFGVLIEKKQSIPTSTEGFPRTPDPMQFTIFPTGYGDLWTANSGSVGGRKIPLKPVEIATVLRSTPKNEKYVPRVGVQKVHKYFEVEALNSEGKTVIGISNDKVDKYTSVVIQPTEGSKPHMIPIKIY